MKFFKSKFFIITLIVTVLVAAVFTAMSFLGYSSYIKAGINYVTVPFQKLSDAVGKALDGYTAYMAGFDKLKKENEELKEQINEMIDDVQSAKAIKEENEELKRMLEVKTEHLDYKFELASVIGRENSNYMTVFTLGQGKNIGIDKDMPIISSNSGLIGKITDAGATWAKASSIVDTGSAVGAYVERSLCPGIVVGEYELGLKGLCKMAYLQIDADIEEGDRIMTSGVGSVYPRGIIIGTVTEVKYDEVQRSKYAVIKPYADISSLNSVAVITSYDRYTEE